jgi:hypothetical protein
MSFSEDDLKAAERSKNGHKPRPKGKIPYLPDRSATLPELREWLSNACGLPEEVRVDTVIRPGREPEDPVTMILSNSTKLRCAHQSRLLQPKTLQAFLASESDGIAQPAYLSPAEVGDVYTAFCRLGTASARSDPVADLHERLISFVDLCDDLEGSLNLEERYVTIETIRRRLPFDRSIALGMKGGQPECRPVLLVDTRHHKRYVRASEWVVYLRFVVGRTVDESGLVARMSELGSPRCEPQAWNGDRSHKTHLVFYELPEDL